MWALACLHSEGSAGKEVGGLQVASSVPNWSDLDSGASDCLLTRICAADQLNHPHLAENVDSSLEVCLAEAMLGSWRMVWVEEAFVGRRVLGFVAALPRVQLRRTVLWYHLRESPRADSIGLTV